MGFVRKIGGKVVIVDTNDQPITQIGTSSGTQFDGGASAKVGFYGVTPQVRPAAMTLTFATAVKTHPNYTATSVATTAPTGTSPKGYTSTAQAGALFRGVNALIVDVVALKKFVNFIAASLQADGLLK